MGRSSWRRGSWVPADMELGITLLVPFWVVNLLFFFFFKWPFLSFPVSSGSL